MSEPNMSYGTLLFLIRQTYTGKTMSFDFWNTPKTAKEIEKQLNAFAYLDKLATPDGQFPPFCGNYRYSKRRERLLKTYWAFKKMEGKHG